MRHDNYRNFDLRLSGTPQSFTVEVMDSPAGQTSVSACVNCSSVASDSFPATDEEMQSIGHALWSCALGISDVKALWYGSLNSLPERTSLRLRLMIEGGELAALPWELLYDKELQRFIAVHPHTSVVRFLKLPIPAVLERREFPLRLLYTGCSPSGLPSISVVDEFSAIQLALGEYKGKERFILEDMHGGTRFEDLDAELNQQTDIWHFAGHGALGVLFFEDQQARAVSISAQKLGQQLVGFGVRLAIINACHSGSGGGASASVAGTLLRAGVAAVVAMQGEITDNASRVFAKGLYSAVADGEPIDDAVTSTRRQLHAQTEDGGRSWWLPALFMRTPDGFLWQGERTSLSPTSLNNLPLPTIGATSTQPATALYPPAPAFDPRWLNRLEAPGGAMRLQSPFYIEREADIETKELILQDGVTIRVKGCRQSGKSSLLARLYQCGRDHQQPSLYIDFQSLDKQQFQSLDSLLLALARLIAARLKTTQSPEMYWQTPLSAKDKLSLFVIEQVLDRAATPLVFLLDEVDRVFSFAEYRDDFFSLIRYWHGQRAIEPCWDKLNIVLSYSSEAFMFITDLNQSPFNVGYEFTLEDFTRPQVEELNRRHGSPLKTAQDIDRIMDLCHGHPYLTRRALYDLVRGGATVDAVINAAANDDGPFADHLHRYLRWFRDDPDLREAMSGAIRNGSCATDEAFYRLRSAGLVRGTSRQDAKTRCGLYAHYFGRHL